MPDMPVLRQALEQWSWQWCLECANRQCYMDGPLSSEARANSYHSTMVVFRRKGSVSAATIPAKVSPVIQSEPTITLTSLCQPAHQVRMIRVSQHPQRSCGFHHQLMTCAQALGSWSTIKAPNMLWVQWTCQVNRALYYCKESLPGGQANRANNAKTMIT